VACLAANKQNITTDEFALLAFKLLITLEPYDMLANNWSTSSSICNWIGVTCDELHNRVHTLNLSNMGLRGTISPNLGNMSFLVILDLSHNIFSSFIPQFIGNLHQLKILDMRNNRLSGPIPQTFSNLTSLEEIRLSHNYLSGTSGSYIMRHICKKKNYACTIYLFTTNCDFKISIHIYI
jgi:LRR receptor-like serine/threonine-protein kinase FLS2